MKIHSRPLQTFYVVFEHSPKRNWLTRYLKDGFTHCYVMHKSSAGLFWIVINPLWSKTLIDYRLVSTFPTARSYAGDHALIIKHTKRIDLRGNCCGLCINSCVDVVKRVIGMDKWYIYTPYQLFKTLRG
jgi:hypothetical protein